MDNICTSTNPITEVSETFGTWDYVIFGALLSISALIGIYFAYVDRNKDSEEYLMGGGNVSPWPIAASLATTFFSAITVLGQPVEFYTYGTMNIYFLLTYLICSVLTCELFVPVYSKYNVTSIYEYLEIRFSTGVRYLGTMMFLLQTVIYIGIVIYAPALALETVTGLDRFAAIWITGAVCIFYTTIGGLKAVVWTDTLQIVVMFSGFLSVIIGGMNTHKSFADVIATADRGGRLIFDDFSADPRVRHSFWSIVFGGTFGVWGHFFCTSQSYVQRVLVCRTRREQRIAVYFGYLGVACILIFSALAGLIMYATYECCDPLTQGWLESKDQLVPYYAVDIFTGTQGAASLFVLAAYAGTLSTVSSGINSMATVIIYDFIKPHCHTLPFIGEITETVLSRFSKILSLFLGVLCIVLTYLVGFLGDGILQAALSIVGMFGGPTLGLFMMGMIFPFINVYGAYSGTISGFCVAVWVYIGSQFYSTPPEFTKPLHLSVESCFEPNYPIPSDPFFPFMNNTVSETLKMDEKPAIAHLYELSYMYLGTLGFIITIVVGSIVSLATRKCHRKPENWVAKEMRSTQL